MRATWKTRFLMGIAAAGLAAAAAVLAKGEEDLDPGIVRILAQMDENSGVPAAQIAAELASLDSAAVRQLCGLVVDDGRGDDARVRRALHGLAFHVGAPGREVERSRLAGTFLTRLAGESPVAVKAFFLRELALFGGAECVDSVAFLLRDEALADAAAKTLLGVALGDPTNEPRVAEVLAESLPAGGEERSRGTKAIVHALGVLGARDGIDRIREIASSQDPELRWMALFALARAGDPVVLEALGKGFEGGSRYARSQALALRLEVAERHAEPGPSAFSGLAPHEECAVLRAFARAKGEEAVAPLLDTLREGDPAVRASRIDILASIPGEAATAGIAARLEGAGRDDRLALLEVLARRRDPVRVAEVSRCLDDGSDGVRGAAAKALEAIGTAEAAAALAAHLARDDDRDGDPVKVALGRMPAGVTREALASARASTHPRIRAVSLEILAAHPGETELDGVIDSLGDPDAGVRTTAAGVLEVVASPSDVPRLLRAMTAAGEDAIRGALARAAAAGCLRSRNEASRARPLVEAWNATSSDEIRGALLGAFGVVGGAEALAVVSDALQGESEAMREAARAALLEWPDADAAPVLLEIARTTEDLKGHVVAMRGAARAAGLARESRAREAVTWLSEGMEIARRDEERKLMLAAVGRLKSRAALVVAARALDDPALRAEAEAAVLGIAETLGPEAWADTRSVVADVFERTESQERRERAQAWLAEMDRFADHITDWLVAGPYTIEGKAGHEIFDVPFPPEDPEASGVPWRRFRPEGGEGRGWLVDLLASMPGDQRAAYLRTQVVSPAAQRARLELGSDDGIKVWLNGEVVHANNALRGGGIAQDIVAVELREGANVLLLKVTNDGGAWNACARVRGPDGAPLAGVFARAASGTIRPEVPPETIARIEAAAPSLAPVRPAKPRKLLVMSLCRGFRHGVIPVGEAALRVLGEKPGAFEAVFTEEPAMFRRENLAEFDAVCFHNSTGELFEDPELRQGLLEFVRGGGGLVGIHAATDCFYQWAEFGEMMGGYFDGHPWNEEVALRIDDPGHPVALAFDGRPLRVADEIYQFRDPYSRARLRVLTSLDPAGTDMTKPGRKRADGDYAVSWVREFGKGRVFYLSLGHRDEIFRNPTVLRHLLAGIQYVMGDLPADATPSAKLAAAPWEPLFDGETLEGWQGFAGDWPKRAAMDAEALARAQGQADERMRAHWRVEEGTLAFDGEGESLVSVRQFGDFELMLDWRIGPDGDSGIYLRGTPQVQIWDAARHPEGSGGLYNNQEGASRPLQCADRPVGEWNTFYVRLVGDRVTVFLNGILVVDGVRLENYWDRERPLHGRGPIELQAHGSPLAFRNLRVREIPAGGN